MVKSKGSKSKKDSYPITTKSENASGTAGSRAKGWDALLPEEQQAELDKMP